MTPADHQTVEDFLDDALNTEALTALQARVAADREFAEHLYQAVTMHGAIRAAAHDDRDGIELQTRVELALGPDQRSCSFTDEVMQQLDLPITARSVPAARPSHLRRVLIVAAPLWAAALLTLAAVIGLTMRRPGTVGSVERLPAGATLTRAGQVRPLTMDENLRDGDWLQTPPEATALAFRLRDGTAMAIDGGGMLQIAGSRGNHLTLLRGHLTAHVTGQPGNDPMIVQSEHATATILGTIFHFSAEAERSELQVIEGKVKFTGYGGEVTVSQGERALVRSGRVPLMLDPLAEAASRQAPPEPYRLFRIDDTTVLLRYGPENGGNSDNQVDTDEWVRHCQAAGAGRILLEAWTLDGIRLWQAESPRPQAEQAWLGAQGDIVARLEQSCAAAGLRFGVACPLNQPTQAAAWLDELLATVPVAEVHFTDLGAERRQITAWRSRVQAKAAGTVVSLESDDEPADANLFGPPMGRFLRIGLEEPRSLLMLSEVEVYAAGHNIALHGTARQSSTGWGGAPERAIDGNTNPAYPSRSISHTGYENSPWWELDLGSDRVIEQLKVWNRTDAHFDQFKTYRVEIRNQRQQIVWRGWMDSLGQRSATLDFAAGDGWLPVRRHLAFRSSRYFRSVEDTNLIGGREIFANAVSGLAAGCQPLLVVTPGDNGHIPSFEVESMMHYRALWRLAFDRPVSTDATVSASVGTIKASWLSDGSRSDSWEGEAWLPEAQLELTLPAARAANALLLREPTTAGSRQALAAVYVHTTDGWQDAGSDLLIGDRLIRFPDSRVDQVRLRFSQARYSPAIEEAVLLDLP